MGLLLGLLLSCLSYFVQAQQPSADVEEVRWEKSNWPTLKFNAKISYDQLCAYDGNFCGKLKNEDKFKVPHPLFLKILWMQKDRLSLLAKKYNIHPYIPMAAITTEHSLNVGIEDQIQENLKSSGFDRDGKLLGIKAVSYGYGQLYAEAAQNAEIIVARVERRKPENQAYIDKRITSIEGAYEYACALMVFFTEEYGKNGMDISNNLGVLTTLYNIGKVNERIKNHATGERKPGVNYFGWFAEENWQVFQDIYDKDDLSIEYIGRMQQSIQDMNNDGWIGKIVGNLTSDFVKSMAVEMEIPLRDAPPQCNLSRDYYTSSMNPLKKEEAYLKAVRDSQMQPFRAMGPFDIYGQSFDCIGRMWGLLFFPKTGKMGWANLEVLADFVGMKTVTRQCAIAKVARECSDQVQSIAEESDSQILEVDESKGLVYLNLGRKDVQDEEVAWMNADRVNDDFCEDANVVNKLKARVAEYRAVQNGVEERSTENLQQIWIDYQNSYRERRSEERKKYRFDLQKEINNIKLRQKRDNEPEYAVAMTESEVAVFTDLATRAISKYEGEFQIELPSRDISNIEPQALWISPEDYGRVSDRNFSDVPIKNFLTTLLAWAYQFREQCIDRNFEFCIARSPLDDLQKLAQDQLEGGFASQSFLAHLTDTEDRKSPLLFSGAGVRGFEVDHFGNAKDFIEERFPMAEAVAKIPQSCKVLSAQGPGFQESFAEITSYLNVSQQSGYQELETYSDRQLQRLNAHCSYLLNEMGIAEYLLSLTPRAISECSMSVFREARGKLSRTRRVDCRIYEKYNWTVEELGQHLNYVITDFVGVQRSAVREIQSRVEKKLFPGDKQAYKRGYDSDRLRLAGCNHDFNKTSEMIQELTELSCVEQVLLPFDPILMNKSREEGVIFNAMPFGEHRDRFALKLKQNCAAKD